MQAHCILCDVGTESMHKLSILVFNELVLVLVVHGTLYLITARIKR